VTGFYTYPEHTPYSKVLGETASEYSLAKYSTSRGSKCFTESS
jgi:hypothetical protein